MPEITAAELKKLRALEARIASANDSLSSVRAKRDEFRASATAARRELRDSQRDSTKLEKQVTELLAENAAMADELELAKRDRDVITSEASTLRSENDTLNTSVGRLTKDLSAAEKKLTTAERATARLEKQLATVSDKLDGNEPPELTPDHLSDLLSDFVGKVSGQTGLEVDGTQLNLKVGFSGRNGGAFVIPSLGVDPDALPELHELKIDLARGLSAGAAEPFFAPDD